MMSKDEEKRRQQEIEHILVTLSTKSNKAVAFQYAGSVLDLRYVVGVAYYNKNINNYHYISYN